MGGSLDLGASLEVNPVFLTARNSFRPLPPPPPDSKPSRPLLQMICLDGQPLVLACGHLNTYQTRPQHSKWELLTLLESLPLQNETCQFLLRTRSSRRQSLLQLLLLRAKLDGAVVQLVEGSVGVAIQPVEGCLGLKSLVAKHQFGPTKGHLLLWHYRCLGISLRWARS